jgi:hypothetical protein
MPSNEVKHIVIGLKMRRLSIMVKAAQLIAGKFIALPTVQEPALDGTGTSGTVPQEIRFVPASLTVLVFLVVAAACAIDATIRQGNRGVNGLTHGFFISRP